MNITQHWIKVPNRPSVGDTIYIETQTSRRKAIVLAVSLTSSIFGHNKALIQYQID